MSWFSFLVALVKLVSSVSQWALRERLINEGQAIFISDVMTQRADEIQRGNSRRLDQRIRDADGGMFDDPDKYRRG